MSGLSDTDGVSRYRISLCRFCMVSGLFVITFLTGVSSHLGVLRIVREGKVAILYRQSALSERKTEETEFVEEAAQGPDVCLGCNGLPTVQVDHLRSSESQQIKNADLIPLFLILTCKKESCTS